MLADNKRRAEAAANDRRRADTQRRSKSADGFIERPSKKQKLHKEPRQDDADGDAADDGDGAGQAPMSGAAKVCHCIHQAARTWRARVGSFGVERRTDRLPFAVALTGWHLRSH